MQVLDELGGNFSFYHRPTISDPKLLGLAVVGIQNVQILNNTPCYRALLHGAWAAPLITLAQTSPPKRMTSRNVDK